MIHLKGIRKSYKTEFTNLEVLKGIDLQINKGDFVSIMGSSGSGKSTLLNILGLLDEYDTGEYTLDGVLMKDLSQTQAALYRNPFLGFVFQSFNLLPFKSAQENVALPLYYKKIPRKERQAKALEYLEKVGLKEWADHLPTQMSGGQQQRVAIARALVGDPLFLLADEPTGNLDSNTAGGVMDLLNEINEGGTTIIMVTHDPQLAMRSQRNIHILDGQISEAESRGVSPVTEAVAVGA